MSTPAGPIMTYRRYWILELALIIALSLGAVVLFASTELDMITVKPYYHPELSSPWPVVNQRLWSLFYCSAPWVTGSLGIAGVSLIIVGMLREKAKRLRLQGLYILLCVIIGPGLIINGALKDHRGATLVPGRSSNLEGSLNIISHSSHHELTANLSPAATARWGISMRLGGGCGAGFIP